MSGYLLDTNTVSYIIKGQPPIVRQRLVRVPIYDVAISAVTEGELRYGTARLPSNAHLRQIVEDFVGRVLVRPWDSAAARTYGRVRAALESSGKVLGNLDMMIAAHALAMDLVLVTHDKAFERVRGLKTEDWTRA